MESAGPDGELGASLRYLSQRFTMLTPEAKAILNDIGTEELGHLEMVGAIVQQLTRDLTPEQVKAGGYDAYYVGHGLGIYPASAGGIPWSACCIQSKGDPITDLYEDMAADDKAKRHNQKIRTNQKTNKKHDLKDILRMFTKRYLHDIM